MTTREEIAKLHQRLAALQNKDVLFPSDYSAIANIEARIIALQKETRQK